VGHRPVPGPTEDADEERDAATHVPGRLAIGTAGLAAVRRVAGAAPTAEGPGARPAGDLARRIGLTARRLTQTGVPAYTDDFILADVTLDTRRRFWNFSGDLSGRWVEALAALPPADRSPADIAPLVTKLLAQQRSDGRFGRTDLAFTAAETGTEHMAFSGATGACSWASWPTGRRRATWPSSPPRAAWPPSSSRYARRRRPPR